MLPEALRAELRMLVAAELRMHAVPRAEFEALQAIVAALRPPLSASDHASLCEIVTALLELQIRELVTAAELVAMAAVVPGPAGDALRKVLARFTGPDPAKALGRLLTRCAGWPVGGVFIARYAQSSSKAPALYRLQGF